MTPPLAKARGTRTLERALGDRARVLLPTSSVELLMFVLKQGWACLFGGLMLAAIVGSKSVWQDDWPLHRYDALLVFALIVQGLFLWAKLETWAEARVIVLFHLTGTVMEWFKVGAGSWAYPEPALFKLLGVPLFSGFMYASVGSYIARVIRIFEMRFAPYPPIWQSFVLAGAIYGNFFAHHVLPDIRLGLFAATLLVFWRTRVWFVVSKAERWMPMVLAAALSSLALWTAENIGTMTGTWIYSGHVVAHWTGLGKLGSWYLLLYVAFVTVSLVSREALEAGQRTVKPSPAKPAG
jgi:uncharacterized membrane protein YoaT (DUF817 family)